MFDSDVAARICMACVDLLTASSWASFSLNTGHGIKSALFTNNCKADGPQI